VGRHCETVTRKKLHFLPITVSELPREASHLGRGEEKQARTALRSVCTTRQLGMARLLYFGHPFLRFEPTCLVSDVPPPYAALVCDALPRTLLKNNTDSLVRFKDQMWQKVATEMGIPWRSAESMHWQLGEQEMSARANAPVFQLHPSATGTGMSSPSQVPVIPASAPHGFTPANAPQLMPNPPPMPPQLHQVPPPMPQGPMHSYHQRADSGSSAGGRRRRNSSFSRRRADARSRSSVPPQLGQPLPQIQPQSEEDLISGARTAPVPGMQSIIKREGEVPSYMEAYHQRRREEEAAGPSRLEYDARSQGMRSPDRMSQRSGTGSTRSMKREPEEADRTSTLPSPPQAPTQPSTPYERPASAVA
jgi:hypothetical protein